MRLRHHSDWLINVTSASHGARLTELGTAPRALYEMLASTDTQRMLYVLDNQHGTSLRALFGLSVPASSNSSSSSSSFPRLRSLACASFCSTSLSGNTAGTGRNARNGPFRISEGEWMQRLTLDPPCLSQFGGLLRHYFPQYDYRQGFDKSHVPELVAALSDPRCLIYSSHFVITVNASLLSQPAAVSSSSSSLFEAGRTSWLLSLEVSLTASNTTKSASIGKVHARRYMNHDPFDDSLVQVQLQVRNPSSQPALLRVTEALPPTYEVLWHTHITYTYGNDSSNWRFVADLPSFRFWPTGGISSPGVVTVPSASFSLTLPARGRIHVVYSARLHLQHRDLQPADASRGVELGAVVIDVITTSLNHYHHLYTVPVGSPLLPTPFPDATMPFNVLTLVSTLLAFVLGSVINALNRKKTH